MLVYGPHSLHFGELSADEETWHETNPRRTPGPRKVNPEPERAGPTMPHEVRWVSHSACLWTRLCRRLSCPRGPEWKRVTDISCWQQACLELHFCGCRRKLIRDDVDVSGKTGLELTKSGCSVYKHRHMCMFHSGEEEARKTKCLLRSRSHLTAPVW